MANVSRKVYIYRKKAFLLLNFAFTLTLYIVNKQRCVFEKTRYIILNQLIKWCRTNERYIYTLKLAGDNHLITQVDSA